MSQNFYVAVNGQQTGPFTYEELKEKGLLRETLIWTEGLDNWTKAGDVALVKDLLRATPPPLPNQERKTEVSPPPIIQASSPTTSQIAGKYFGYELAGRLNRLLGAIMNTLIIGLSLFLLVNILGMYERINDYRGCIFFIEIVLVLVAPLFYSQWSGNLGHKIMGLKVISSIDGSDYNKAFQGLLRDLLHHLLGVFILPSIWLLWDDDRQNLYDKIVKTYVVKKKLG